MSDLPKKTTCHSGSVLTRPKLVTGHSRATGHLLVCTGWLLVLTPSLLSGLTEHHAASGHILEQLPNLRSAVNKLV